MDTHVVDILMPKMGESIMEATILKWLKREGDIISEGESIAEISTDKVDSEIPSMYSGTIEKILVGENSIVNIGSAIAKIRVNKKDVLNDISHTSQGSIQNDNKNILCSINKDSLTNQSPALVDDSNTHNSLTSIYDGRYYSPLVRKMISDFGITNEETKKIPGTGVNFRVTKDDLVNYLSYRPTNYQDKAEESALIIINSDINDNRLSVYVNEGDEVITMDRVRSVIAKRMLDSKHTIPHVTSFTEANVSNMVNWVSNNKDDFYKKYGVKLTYSSIFIEYLAKVLIEMPMLNSLVIGNKIVQKKNINIGVAVSLNDGNLIVPVIKDVDKLSLDGIATNLETLVSKARNNKLNHDDVAGGTYTLTNLGSFNNLMGTPIIMKPQVGIMGVGAIKKKVDVITTSNEDKMGIVHKVYLSHSFDHRVIDGAVGGHFSARLASHLENFDLNRLI